jgi:hypothetical protein
MLPFENFSRYWQALLELPTQDRYDKDQLRCERFLLFSESGLEAYYVPFHYLNAKARIVLVGVTPGWTQMERAFWAAKDGLAHGLSGEQLFNYIDKTGSFSGPMRKNLVEMLDGIGLGDCLGIDSCTDLFSNSSHLVHFTSAMSAPVFKRGDNYAGSSPKALDVPKLRTFVLENLAAELNVLPDAIIVPLGKVPGEAVQFLQTERLIALNRCLIGFPHPSGANGWRKPHYESGRQHWREQLSKWFAP